MTWRRFRALLGGLSPNSAFQNHHAARNQARSGGRRDDVITDSAQGEAAVLQLFKGG